MCMYGGCIVSDVRMLACMHGGCVVSVVTLLICMHRGRTSLCDSKDINQ